MPYRFLNDESVKAGVRRIACEQIDKSIEELDDGRLSRAEAIHQVRKRCKKIRGLLRLVRPELGNHFARENAHFRDAARCLGALRDAAVLIESYDSVMTFFAGQVERRSFAPIRRALTLRHKQLAEEQMDLGARVEAFQDAMREARSRAHTWPIKTSGFAALAGGLEKSYRQGRAAMARAYEDRSDEAFHEWRKRVKDHWYHCRMLEDTWKPLMAARCQALEALSELLGQDHDLAVLRQLLAEEPKGFGRERTLQAFVALLGQRRADLQARARPLGERAYAEKPNALRNRLEHYWNAWHTEAELNRAAVAHPGPQEA